MDPRMTETQADQEPQETAEAWRWALGLIPWFVFVGCLALVDGVGCVPVEEPAGDDDITPASYGDDDDATGDDDDALGGPYPAVFSPDPDAVGFPRINPLWVEFSQELDVAAISLVDADGDEVPVRSLRVGDVRFMAMPDEALDGDATYTATVTWDGDDSFSWSFTTAAAHPSVGDPTGVTIAWDIPGGDASSPPGAEAFVNQLPLTLLTAIGGTSDAVSVLAAGGQEVDGGFEQDLCVPTFEPTESEPAQWGDPLLQTPAALFRLTVDLSIAGFGVEVLPLRDVRLVAELAADQDGITGLAEGMFVGFGDLREVALPGLCDTLGGVAINCTPCPGDGAEQCMVFALHGIQGVVADVQLVPRLAADVKADPDCLPETEGG